MFNVDQRIKCASKDPVDDIPGTVQGELRVNDSWNLLTEDKVHEILDPLICSTKFILDIVE